MIGKRLKELRINKKMTQEELGKKINVTKVSISGYENGNRSPDTETLQKIADTFGVTTDYLLGRSDKPHLTEEEEFLAFANDPELGRWYRELPKSDEEDLRKLRDMWEIMRRDRNS